MWPVCQGSKTATSRRLGINLKKHTADRKINSKTFTVLEGIDFPFTVCHIFARDVSRQGSRRRFVCRCLPRPLNFSSANISRFARNTCVAEMADPKDPDLHAEEDEYVSEEDEDFNPDAAAAGENVSSSSESEVGKPVTKGKSGKKAAKQRRRKTRDEEAEDAGVENSGDEGMIEQCRKRKRNGNVDEDSGGEGGFVQTRGMKATA